MLLGHQWAPKDHEHDQDHEHELRSGPISAFQLLLQSFRHHLNPRFDQY